MRKRFKRERLCSSENYKESRNYRKEYIKEQHPKNILEVETIIEKTVLIKHPYVNCFGVLMPITVEEAVSLTINIIWK